MYHRKNPRQLEFPDFYLPFSGELNPDNRWIALARLVPWDLAQTIYHAELCEDFGAPIVSSRVALGALLIKERLGLTDRETVEAIQENPYLQFFIGCEEFSHERPFDASLMVGFRKRFGAEGMQQIGEAIALASLPKTEPPKNEPPNKVQGDSKEPTDDDSEPPASEDVQNESAKSEAATESQENCGRLIADATCAPADIR